MKKLISIFLIICTLIILNGCDLFNKEVKNDSNIDFYVECVKLPTNFVQETQRAVITIAIQKINFSDVDMVDVDREFQLLSSSLIPICSLKVRNDIYQPYLTLILSPKATVDVYNGNLLISTHNLTLASTTLSASLVKYESYDLESYDSLDINSDENFYILMDFSNISDLYSDISIATPNIYFSKAEDLVNVSGRIWGNSEYRIEFNSPAYLFNTFTTSQNYSIKLFKGAYDVSIEVYEFDNDFPTTSTSLSPIEDTTQDFFPE